MSAHCVVSAVLTDSPAALCRKQRRLSCTREFGVAFARNDVIGCGIEWAKERLFFTVNGKLVGRVFSHSLEKRRWFAFIRAPDKKVGTYHMAQSFLIIIINLEFMQLDVVNANLDGHEAFRFDVDSYISQESH